MTFRRLFIVAALALAAPACATSSQGRFDTARVPELTRSDVRRAEALAWFGEPADIERAEASSGGCVEAWHWSNPTRETFQNLTVYFDDRGVACGHRFSGPPRLRESAGRRLLRIGARRLASRAP